MRFLSSCQYTHGCCARASWAARHTTVCLDRGEGEMVVGEMKLKFPSQLAKGESLIRKYVFRSKADCENHHHAIYSNRTFNCCQREKFLPNNCLKILFALFNNVIMPPHSGLCMHPSIVPSIDYEAIF